MKTPFHHLVAVAVLLSLTGCAINPPQEFQQKEESPVIYPDYSGITLPHNIAPMNFQIEEDGEQFIAVASAPKGKQLIASGKAIQWNLKEWHRLLDGNRGDTLSIDIYVQKEGTWNRYRTIKNLIVQEAIDPYLSYRLIEPLYVFYENMSLCQRDLTCFDERTLVNNGRPVEEERGRCVNCHAYQDYNRGGNMQFHVRGYKGGTLLATEDGVRKVDLKSEKSPFDGVYPAWHPTLPLIAYSTNSTRQHFHSKDRQKVEVMDLASGLILYDTKNNRVKTISDKPDELETFPAWSPDGRTLYYVSARYPEGVPMEKDSLFNHYQEFHYDIFRKTFDPESRRHGRYGPGGLQTRQERDFPPRLARWQVSLVHYGRLWDIPHLAPRQRSLPNGPRLGRGTSAQRGEQHVDRQLSQLVVGWLLDRVQFST